MYCCPRTNPVMVVRSFVVAAINCLCIVLRLRRCRPWAMVPLCEVFRCICFAAGAVGPSSCGVAEECVRVALWLLLVCRLPPAPRCFFRHPISVASRGVSPRVVWASVYCLASWGHVWACLAIRSDESHRCNTQRGGYRRRAPRSNIRDLCTIFYKIF